MVNQLPLSVIFWAVKSPIRLFNILKLYSKFRMALKRMADCKVKDGLQVPMFLIISPTSRCNLACKGCYSKQYSREEEVSLEVLDKLVTESKALGTFFYVIAGGEPLLRKELLSLFSKHNDVAFFLYTNGMLMTDEIAKEIKKLYNTAVIVSIEGFKDQTDNRRGSGVHEKVLNAMEILRQNDIFMGFSATVNRANLNILMKDEFFRGMIKNGCRMGTYVDYIPCDRNNDLVLTKDERTALRDKIMEWKKIPGFILFQLPDDEHELAGRCLSAGYGFLHITSKGYVEPCPFVHYASDNILDKPFKEILRSEFLAVLREKEALFTEDEIGCGLFENLDQVEKIAKEYNAVSTISEVASMEVK